MAALEAFLEVVKIVLIVLGSAVGVLLLVALFGCFLPRSHVAARTLRSKKTPEDVWNVLCDYASVPTWHPEVKKVERQPDKNGHDVWRETDKRGYAVQLETIEAAAPRRLVRAIADESGPFTGQWEFDIAPADEGSRVTLTERGQIANPFFRVMFRAFMTPSFYLELYLKALAAKLGDEPVLEELTTETQRHREDKNRGDKQ
jgi:uncharacterized protein YndB with AHSA1/START domain